MEHASLPDNYYTDDIWHNSPLNDDEREGIRDEDTFDVSVYLIPDELETDPQANETIDEGGEAIISEGMHYFRDIGQEWDALEYDIISELVSMLDLLEMPTELANHLLGGNTRGPCLYCTMRSTGQVSFSITAYIPETTQRIYDDAEFEFVRRLNIPIAGSSK